ncbi:MAG: hypothetical protein CMP80_02910 [Formosa sp.]|nr:hypothetical protein [Formosa sp.]
MYTIFNYLISFWTVVVMNCIQPVNWKYCYRVDQWLVPDIQEGWKHYTGEIVPYQTEKDYLNQDGLF